MPDPTTPSSGGFLSGTRANDVLAALQNGVQAINNAANTITTKISSIVTANPGGSSGQVQFNTGTGFGGFTVGGDATLISSAGTLTINSHAITYGKIQAESSGTLLGNLGTGSTSPSEQASSTVTAFLGTFSSVVQGVVPASSNSNTSTSYLGGDAAFHPVATGGFTFLGTVNTVSSQIVDTSTTSNIIAANSTVYRSFMLCGNNILPNTNNVSLGLQVHSGGAFQTTNYVSAATRVGPAATLYLSLTSAVALATAEVPNSSESGYSCTMRVPSLGGTSVVKTWHGNGFTGSVTVEPINFGGYWGGGNGAVDGFLIAPSAGAITSGTVDIYGML